MRARLHLGDCLELLATLPDNSIDSVVTDPPYGLGKPPKAEEILTAWLAGERAEVSGGGFMGKDWDAFVPGPRIWREVYRVTKPGGHAVVFAGTRTLDWMAIACRLAGWEVRDSGVWCYWSGFPKSLDVSKAIDKAAGAERKRTGRILSTTGNRLAGSVALAASGLGAVNVGPQTHHETAPATDDAKRWEGWGTALKPAWEPWLVLRKPIDGTVAANVLEHGTGGINVDGCRFKPGDPMWPGPQYGYSDRPIGRDGTSGSGSGSGAEIYGGRVRIENGSHSNGRWPSNLIHAPKPSRTEREQGLDRIPGRTGAEAVERVEGSAGINNPRAGAGRTADTLKNDHPTVKPRRLMAWLVRLVTPPGGTVLDPFMGSGTTGAAATGQGFDFMGADLSARYVAIAHERIRHSAPGVTIDAPREALDILQESTAPTLWDTLSDTRPPQDAGPSEVGATIGGPTGHARDATESQGDTAPGVSDG